MARTATKRKAANPTDAVHKALRGDDTDLRAVLAQTYRYGVQAGTEGLIRTGIVKAAPDITDVQDEAVAWAAEHSAEMISGLDSATVAAVQQILARAVQRGWTDTYTGQQVNKLIGLNAQQALAVDNYRSQMLMNGIPPGTAQRRSDDYAKRLQRRHAKQIAGNEIRAAYMAGQRQAWKNARDLGDVSPYAVRIVRTAKDERRCNVCKPLNGARTSLVGGTYPVKQGSTVVNMDGPPFHPNCRCIEVLQDLPMGDVPAPHPIQKAKVRRVRTLAGAQKYNLPIGSPIVAKPDVPKLPTEDRSKPWVRKVIIDDRVSDVDFFRRFNRGTKYDFTTTKTTYGVFEVSEKQKAHTKQGVSRALRARIKQQQGWEDEVDKIDWHPGHELNVMGIPIPSFARREQPSLKYDGQEAHDQWLRDYLWPEVTGVDEVATDVAKSDRLADNLEEAFRRVDKYSDRLYDLGIWKSSDGSDPDKAGPNWDDEVKTARMAVNAWRAWDEDTPGERSNVSRDLWSMHARIKDIFDSVQGQVNDIGFEDDMRAREFLSENPGHDGPLPDHVKILGQDEHFIFSNSFSSERVLKVPTVIKAAEDLPDDLTSEELDREVKLAALTRLWIDQWATSSNGESTASHAFQRAVAVWSDEKFGTAAGRLDKLKDRHTATHTDSDQDLKTHGRFLAMHMIPAIYDETQEYLKDQDIDSIRLYRGMKFDSRPGWVPKKDVDGSGSDLDGIVDDIDFEANPASSWAVMPHTARGFASSQFPVVATMDVPREMILSTSVSGIGALDENEVVVLGWTRAGRAYWFDSHNSPGALPGAEDILVKFHGKQPLSEITDGFLKLLED